MTCCPAGCNRSVRLARRYSSRSTVRVAGLTSLPNPDNTSLTIRNTSGRSPRPDGPRNVQQPRPRDPGRACVALTFRGAIVLGLAALAVWQSRSSTALADARAAERAHDHLTALVGAMDRLDRAPRDPEAALVAARCLTRLKYVDQAEIYYDRARKAGLLTLADLHERALNLTLANRVEEAVKAYEEMLKIHPDDPMALQSLSAVKLSRMRDNFTADRLCNAMGSSGWILSISSYAFTASSTRLANVRLSARSCKSASVSRPALRARS